MIKNIDGSQKANRRFFIFYKFEPVFVRSCSYDRPFSVCKGSYTRLFFEDAAKITRIVETDVVRDLRDGTIFVFKLTLCLLDPFVQYVFPDADPL